MRNPIDIYRENPFFRSTVNVVLIQTMLMLVTILVFGLAIRHQQVSTQEIIDIRRAEHNAGMQLSPESLDQRLIDLRDDTLWASFLALVTLVIVFGYISARYALTPTLLSLEYQKRFIGNLAHELRTPLSIIRTNAEVALMDTTLEGYPRDALGVTIEELDRISGIINNLLSFNSLMKPGQIRFEPVDMRDTAQEVIARHTALAESFGIALAVEAETDSMYVMGNRIALEQVLTNLLKNAVNYTPQNEGRTVTVRLADKGENIAVSVIDNGIGIAQKDLYFVFQPYFRGDTSRDRRIGSGTSGLGLAIVNDIVRAHQGSILVRSALNRGTTIELTFPKADTREHIQHMVDDGDDTEEHSETILG